MKFVVRFTNDIELSYDLVNHTVTSLWKDLIVKHNINDCCKINHYLGYASEDDILHKIERLYQLSDIINLRVPERVIKHPITVDSWKNSLHLMHTHFPDLKNNNSYIDLWELLTEYNDIIHWLESVLPTVWESSTPISSKWFRITLDFNKSNTEMVDIPEDAYSLFDPGGNFGDLMLHYTHVGKNAYELFITNDFECPKDQFVPQRTFSASVRLHFMDNFLRTVEQHECFNTMWNKFYLDRGGKDFFGYEIDDPKLAFGFMKIGTLTNISVQGNEQPIPISHDDIELFRKSLTKSKILEWYVLGS